MPAWHSGDAAADADALRGNQAPFCEAGAQILLVYTADKSKVALHYALWGPLYKASLQRHSRLPFLLSQGIPVVVHAAAANEGLRSSEGIEVCGRRLADEIESLAAQHSPACVHLVGFSLGGIKFFCFLVLIDLIFEWNQLKSTESIKPSSHKM